MTKKCCGNCKHALWELTPTGRIKKAYSGRCAVPMPDSITVLDCPSSIALNGQVQRQAIWPDKGADCPCFVDIAGEKRRAIDDVDGYQRPGMHSIKIVNQASESPQETDSSGE